MNNFLKLNNQSKMITYIDGKFVKTKDAKISINDLGFTNGDMI